MTSIETLQGIDETSGVVRVGCKDGFTGKIRYMHMTVDFEKLMKYAMKPEGLIQDVFPELNENEREFIMTGMLPDEWDDMMGEED